MRQLWLHLDAKERKGLVAFLQSVCWCFTIPIHDRFFLETFSFLSFILCWFVYILDSTPSPDLKPIRHAFYQHPGRASIICVSAENLDFLYLILSSTKYGCNRDCEINWMEHECSHSRWAVSFPPVLSSAYASNHGHVYMFL